MDIHEYQAKALLKGYGVPIAAGGLAYSPEQAAYRAKEIGVMQLCPRAGGVSDEMVERSRDVAQEVRAWGLAGSPAQVADLCRHIVGAGCDGATINWPDWLSHA